MYKLWIEGPHEDSEFNFYNLERALKSYTNWTRDPRNCVALFECVAGEMSRQSCIKTNCSEVHGHPHNHDLLEVR